MICSVSHRLAANLLRSLCTVPKTRDYIKVYDGIPILLSQLVKDTGQYISICRRWFVMYSYIT